MTLQELETRVHQLERQLTDVQRVLQPLAALSRVEDTFGMFADDAGYDEILKLGREYREQVNSENGN